MVPVTQPSPAPFPREGAELGYQVQVEGTLLPWLPPPSEVFIPREATVPFLSSGLERI